MRHAWLKDVMDGIELPRSEAKGEGGARRRRAGRTVGDASRESFASRSQQYTV